MMKKFLNENFPDLEFDENDRLFDHENKNCFIIKCIAMIDSINNRTSFKNDLGTVSYKDYKVAGILVLNNITKMIEVEVFQNKVLILLGYQENIPEMLKTIISNINFLFANNIGPMPTGLSLCYDLNIIKKNCLDIIDQINLMLSSNFKTILEFPKENLYRELLFSDKIDKKKILLKYPDYITTINDIKPTILDAKEYFKHKTNN